LKRGTLGGGDRLAGLKTGEGQSGIDTEERSGWFRESRESGTINKKLRRGGP